MMRLIAICLSLPLVLGAALAGGQEAQPGTAKSAAQNTSAKQQSSASKKVTTSHHARKKHRKASAHKGTKRVAYRPEYSDNSVEVINGDAAKKVVFHDDQAAAVSAKAGPRQAKKAIAGPVPMKVEVMNGSSMDTQYFSGKGKNEQIAAVRNQQVVVGVQSSNTRVAGGNKRPVVTSVNSAGSGDAKAAGNGGQPVTNGVSPRPKRPEYQPDEH
jgi:hypothetical protein